MKFSHAILRRPGHDFAQGITTRNLGFPNYELMLQQHQSYAQMLASLGLEVTVLDALPNFPDAYFVEDVAVITPQVAVITRPGAESRQGEEESIAPVLEQYRSTVRIQSPATLEGGDVLMVGDHFFIGISTRTNQAGANQLIAILESFSYTCSTIAVDSGLHLKSNLSLVSPNTFLITSELARHEAFNAFHKVVLDREEHLAANTLWINEALIMPAGFPRTRAGLEELGLNLIELDTSEARKMDGGLSCMSLRF
jgi:dimethylargininase